MDITKSKKNKAQEEQLLSFPQEQKLSFGSALKKNVKIIIIIIIFFFYIAQNYYKQFWSKK